MGDPTLSTMTSMKAIDEWIAAINGNMSGAGRTGYKASKVTFGGGTPQVIRSPDSTKLPVQTPGESLSVAQTTLDFSQGVITASTEVTHLAISGTGFFKLAQDLDLSQDPPVATGNVYYSRDGEFTLTPVTSDAATNYAVYTNAQGLYLISASDAGAFTVADEVVTNATISDYITNASTLGSNTLAQFVNPQGLKYSSYGSTIFEAGAAVADTTTTFSSTVQENSLEASNSALQLLVPELSLAQKMFQALTKVLQVHHSNIDSLINVIR